MAVWGKRGERGGRDDRVYPSTRWVAALIVPFLLAGFFLLYGWPHEAQRLFAWPVRPRMTALVMGAGYVAGAYFFARVCAARRWHTVGRGFLPVTAFAWSMALATALHWERFTPGHPAFLIWVALYAVTPFVVPLVWQRNRRTDPRTPEPGERLVAPAPRAAVAALSLTNLGAGLLLLVRPDLGSAIWPWQLTPLTARVLGGWFVLPAVTGLALAGEGRWSAWRVPLQSALVGLLLILAGVGRAWSDFDPRSALSWLFVLAVALTAAVFLAVHLALDGARPPAGALGAAARESAQRERR